MSIIGTIAFAAFAAPAALLTAAHVRTRNLAQRALEQVPQCGKIQLVQGGAIHFVEEGPKNAQPLVMIHGLSGQLQHFTYGMASDLAKDFRVIALDRPGCGYSYRASDHLAALPEQAGMILEFLEARGVENPIVVGHSLGGAVALAMALERPDYVKSLALIAPLTHPTEEGPEAFKGLLVHSEIMRKLIAQTVAVPMAKRTAPEVLAEVFAPEPCPDDFLIRGGGALGLRPQAFVTASADLVASGDGIGAQAQRYESALRTPGGVLFGDGDSVLDPAVQGHPMQDFGLTYEALDGKGHMLPVTDPQACCDFVRRVAGA